MATALAQKKRELLGDNKRPIGGTALPANECGDEDDNDNKHEACGETPPSYSHSGVHKETVFWWSIPTGYVQQLVQPYHAKCVVDLSPSSGECA